MAIGLRPVGSTDKHKDDRELFRVLMSQKFQLFALSESDDAVVIKHMRDMAAARDALCAYLNAKMNPLAQQ